MLVLLPWPISASQDRFLPLVTESLYRVQKSQPRKLRVLICLVDYKPNQDGGRLWYEP